MTPRKKKEEVLVPAPASAERAGLLEGMSDLDSRVLAERAESLAQEAVEELPDEVASVMLFRLGEEWYAVRVEAIREIFSGFSLTRVPCTASRSRKSAVTSSTASASAARSCVKRSVAVTCSGRHRCSDDRTVSRVA